MSALLGEMTGIGGSTRYEELVENVCDDLIEGVNNQLDMHKRSLNPEKSTVLQGTLKQERFSSQDKP